MNDEYGTKLIKENGFETVRPETESEVIIEKRDDGVTVTVLPLGLLKGPNHILSFCVLFFLFATFFLVAIGIMVPTASGPTDSEIFMYAMVSIFWLVGLALMVYAVNGKKRTTIIDLVGQPAEFLLLTRKGLFGVRQKEWPTDRIKKVKVGDSSTEVNEVAIPELQIRMKDAISVGLLLGYPEDDLEWLAEYLRNELGLM